MATLPSDIADQLPEGMSVRIASLTDEGQQQVLDALTEAQSAGPLTEETFQDTVSNAESADYARENVEIAREAQAEAADSGDYAKAQEYANQAEYELREIDHLGGAEAEEEVLEAQTDQVELATAQDHADYAQENAEFAASDRGTEAAREVAADTAGDYAASSAQYGNQADAGGVYGDQSYSATTTDTTTDTAGTEGTGE
jgi:hypothetical protein